MPEFIFTFQNFGQQVRVTALDVETKTEVVMPLPATLSKQEMETVIQRKLLYKIEKNKENLRMSQASALGSSPHCNK